MILGWNANGKVWKTDTMSVFMIVVVASPATATACGLI